MQIARVTGTVTATVKDVQLTAHPLLIVDVEDGKGKILTQSIVAADTCSAGVGDMVLITCGSSARLPKNLTGVPVDTAIIAIIEQLKI
jgi:ethanolamine utilization protein EutN